MSIGFSRIGLACILITATGLALRLWRFREGGELAADEALFANVAAGLFNRQSILGWETLLRFNYGLVVLTVIGLWERLLIGLGISFDEKTLHLPEVLVGMLLVWTSYFVVKRFAGKGPALMVSALVAVMPVYVSQSRSMCHWMLAAWMGFVVIYLALKWQDSNKWYLALGAGVASAIYIQTDGIQLFILASVPLLLWLPARGGSNTRGSKFAFLAAMAFAVSIVGCGVLLRPDVMELLFTERAKSWSGEFLTKLGYYSSIFLIYGATLFAALISEKLLIFPERVRFVWYRLTSPWFLVPAGTSFLLVVAVALESWLETGVPQGILGHVFAKEERGFGLYLARWAEDLVSVCGIPVVMLILLGLLVLPWSGRKMENVSVPISLVVLTNIPWLFLVPPAYEGRETYMLASSIAVLSLSLWSLWIFFDVCTQRLSRSLIVHKGMIFSVLIVAICIATVPFTLAYMTRKPVLGIGPYGRNHYGAIFPATGSKQAFEYVRKYIKADERAFTDLNKNIGRFYLERPFGKECRGRVLGVFTHSGRDAAEALRGYGLRADWYVVSTSFSKTYKEDFESSMGLRAIFRAGSEGTEVWQRNYREAVEVHVVP